MATTVLTDDLFFAVEEVRRVRHRTGADQTQRFAQIALAYLALHLDEVVGVAAVLALQELGGDVEVEFAAARFARVRPGTAP